MPWTYQPSLADPRASMAAATCDAPSPGSGYVIYAIGGQEESGAIVATAAAYDTDTKSWAAIAPMITARAGLGATAGPGRLYALGGGTPPNPIDAHEIYDPVDDTWSSAAPLPTARISLAAVTGPDGTVYALGGMDVNGNTLATVDAYDPTTDQWTPGASTMLTPRAALAAVTGPDGLIYAIGGLPGVGSALNSVEVFDPATNVWQNGLALPDSTLFGLAAAVGPDGLIYVFGGSDTSGSDGTVLDTVYSYDPLHNPGEWVTQAPLLIPTTYLAGATGPDGRIYAIGGDSPTETVGAVEAFTVATRQTAPDPYTGNGTYQSPEVILVGNPVMVTGEPGAWGTEVQYNSSYGIQALVYNDSTVAAADTTVRFWRFTGEVGSAGTLIDTQTVTVPANGSVQVTSAKPFQTGAVGQQESVAVSIANPKSPYFSVDPTTAAQVIDPTVAHPPGSFHYGSAWRQTTSVDTLAVSPGYCENLLSTLVQAMEGGEKLTVSMGISIARELETCHLRGYLNEGQYAEGVEALTVLKHEPITPPRQQPP
jgi:Kelch motif